MTDVMHNFELYQPETLADAHGILADIDDAWIVAGGMDSFDWFKHRVKQPSAVVDIAGILELRGIGEEDDGGLRIGALTTLTEVAESELVRERFPLLADAALRVASPQIRNIGTIGGNVSQDTRCWYYRDGMPCYRAGGNTCYADTPTAQNREHTLFGADRCVAVTPSDTGVALVALDATMVIRNRGGEREVAAEEFFIGPSVDITRMTVLEPGDILTAIRVPGDWAGARFYFEKVADRETWDFALVSIASAIVMNGGTVERSRVVCGGVECVPKRLRVVEDSIAGEALDEELGELVARAAVRGARPLNHNHFKVPLMANLVKRSLRTA
jgi:xanthine dehydrogenase YagS FAD-binding subunit